MPYRVDVGKEVAHFEYQKEAYAFLVMMLKDVPLLFQIWTTLNMEHQLEQVGMFCVQPTILPPREPGGVSETVKMGEIHGRYKQAYPIFRGQGGWETTLPRSERKGWFPSISYEQFICLFPEIPFSVLDLLGERKGGWKVTHISSVRGPPPGLGKPHRQPVNI